jgi:hypothetical protein
MADLVAQSRSVQLRRRPAPEAAPPPPETPSGGGGALVGVLKSALDKRFRGARRRSAGRAGASAANRF